MRPARIIELCGLVERSSQGADRMFKAALDEGKLPPDFNASTGESVIVQLHGAVQDEAFIVFLQRIAAEKEKRFSVADLVVLDTVHRGLDIPAPIADRQTAFKFCALKSPTPSTKHPAHPGSSES